MIPFRLLQFSLSSCVQRVGFWFLLKCRLLMPPWMSVWRIWLRGGIILAWLCVLRRREEYYCRWMSENKQGAPASSPFVGVYISASAELDSTARALWFTAAQGSHTTIFRAPHGDSNTQSRFRTRISIGGRSTTYSSQGVCKCTSSRWSHCCIETVCSFQCRIAPLEV